LAYLFNWLLILLANCWPKCYAKLQLPFAGLWGQVFFFFGIGFNLSPTTSQLPVLPAIALATLFGGERGGF